MRSLTERIEIRLAGEGGQGVILAGVILAEAATLEGLCVAQVQSYGPEARGGASKAEVVLSTQEIDYPEVLQADVLVALSQEALRQFSADVREDGLILVEESRVEAENRANLVRLPLTRLAFEATGRTITTNMVALGALVGLTKIVSRAALEEAVKKRAPRGSEEMNRKALEAGFAAAMTIPSSFSAARAGVQGNALE